MSNRLKNEKSPYLRQHAENPVEWYPWGSEAFKKAKAENKPVFLSIGYSTCHWCHVMAHESFEDSEIADILNRFFVSVKVDREERPDIDSVYMSVCQAVTGSGGWPLTIIMTPEQKPFFAATYLPKKGRFGQAGLAELLMYISALWNNDEEKIKLLENAEKITSVVSEIESSALNLRFEKKQYDKELLKKAYTSFAGRFDKLYGGFGAAPKFPSPHNLIFLMDYAKRENAPEAMKMALTTLDAMAAGGIFDQIGGGFSRYSTDEKWLAPHFEKMLYDNALLLSAYVKSYRITQNERYADIARRTADYMLRELRHPAGGFYCAQDADSEGIEGLYYLFTEDEVLSVLGEKDGKEFCTVYNITKEGNFEGKSIPNLIANPQDAWRAGDPRLEKLYAYRKHRAPLHTDDKVLTLWTSLSISALAQAGLVLEEPRYLDAAKEAAHFISENMTDTHGGLFISWHGNEKNNCESHSKYDSIQFSNNNAFDSKCNTSGRLINAEADGQLSDYAAYALALLSLYNATLDAGYLSQAIFYARRIPELFTDEKSGGFFQSAFNAEQLILRPKEMYDGAVPSGNSLAAMLFEELAKLTGEIYWREAADKQHQFTASCAEISPADFSFAMTAFMKALYPQQELICAAAESRIPSELSSYIRSADSENTSILFKSPINSKLLAECAPFTADYPVPGADTAADPTAISTNNANNENSCSGCNRSADVSAVWYLCKNGACTAPTSDFYSLNL